MAPKKKEHNNDLRNLVIQHYQNGDSQREIAPKILLPRTTVQYMIEKYKSTKCIGKDPVGFDDHTRIKYSFMSFCRASKAASNGI